MLKPKVGDLVRMKPLLVTGASETEFRVGLACNPYWLRNTDIEDILPGPLAVGDRVTKIQNRGAAIVGTILALAEGEAWVQWDDKLSQLLFARVLRRVDLA